MAIQPLDLQTLFTQVDKVGKTQSAQREGLAMQQAIQGAQLQRKTEEQIQSVNQAQDTGDGAEKVKDRGAREQEAEDRERKKKESGGEPGRQEQRPPFFRDPSLGQNIDISL
jgi:hypothetical protein